MGSALAIATCIAGIASQYAPGVMQVVIRNRQLYGQLPETIPKVSGYAAVYDCTRIGNTTYINYKKFLIVDCAGDDTTRQWMTRNNIIAEIDYESATTWDTIGRGMRVTMCDLYTGKRHEYKPFQQITPQ